MREMSKLLSNLVSAAQVAKAAREASRDPAKPRKQQAATKKARAALFAAIEKRDLPALEDLVDWGVPMDAAKNGEPLLALCANTQWAEGFDVLLKRGAPTKWPERDKEALEKSGGKTSPLVGRNRWSKAGSFIEAMAEDNFAHGISALWDGASPSEIKKAAKLVSEFDSWKVFDDKGMGGLMPQDDAHALANDMLSNCEKSDAPERSFFVKIKNSRTWTSKELGSWWLMAIEQNNPSLIEFASSTGALPNPDGSVEIAPIDLLSQHYFHGRENYPLWFKSADAYRAMPNEEGKKKRVFSLAELVCLNVDIKAGSAFRALLELPEFMDQIMASDFARHTLAQSKDDIELYPMLAERGLALADLVDIKGRNPLHWAVADELAKSKLDKLARMCEPWIHQQDADGARPLDLADRDAKQSINLIFDKIGMREALGGRRGSKVKIRTRL